MKVHTPVILTIICMIGHASASDWPQLQHDAARTGRTTDELAPPYRLRWFWQGFSHVVRNRLSNTSWSGPDFNQHDIITVKAPDVPSATDFTLAAPMQPIVAGGTVFIGDQEGKVYAIRADDGGEVWTAENSGGTMASGAFADGIVVFVSLRGDIRAFNAATGAAVWEARTGGPITAAPLIAQGKVVAASHDRHVYCHTLATGARLWRSVDLGGQIAGGIASDGEAVYCVTESMRACKINLRDGSLAASLKINGQSHYLQHPVVFNGKVYIVTNPIPAIGSEGTGEGVAPDLIAAATSVDDEQDRWLDFMRGQGGYADASPDWKFFFALKTSDMTEAFQVPNGVYEGCGTPPEPPVVDNSGRVLTYWRTKWNYFARDCGWGCQGNTQIDISAINQSTGRRIIIDNGRHDDEWYTWESDNLYAMSVAGNYLFLHQDYRGTVCISLAESRGHRIWSNAIETATSWNNIDAIYTTGYDDNPPNPPPDYPETPTNSIDGRAAPVVSGPYLFIRESWGCICMEKIP